MEFKTFWQSMPITNRKVFAGNVGASYSTLNQHAFGRPVSAEIHIAIERESGGIVKIPADLLHELSSAGYAKCSANTRKSRKSRIYSNNLQIGKHHARR